MTTTAFTRTFSLPLAAYLGCPTSLSRRGHSRLDLERLPEGLFGRDDKNSWPLGHHSSAASGVRKKS